MAFPPGRNGHGIIGGMIDKAFWDEHGYLVLPAFFERERTDRVVAAAERAWRDRDERVVADRQIYDPAEPRVHKRLSELTGDERTYRYVLNDLYLTEPDVRAVALDPKLVAILNVLMGKPVIVAQSLNFKWGTEIGLHKDSLYLPPPSEDDMLAIWVALEDVDPAAGPLTYVSGSHRIPPYRFSNGSMYHVLDEMDDWRAFWQDHARRMGLPQETFPARRGDVFVWHSHLIHGGSPIADRARTRQSLVCHYYSMADCLAGGWNYAFEGGGFWWNRGPRL